MRIRSKMRAVLAMGGALAFTRVALAQDYPTPSFDCANVMSPQGLQICRSQALAAAVERAAPEPVKPAAVKTAPAPEPVGADDDDDEDESSGSVIAITLAALALAVWLVFRAARRTPVNASGERDASGDRP